MWFVPFSFFLSGSMKLVELIDLPKLIQLKVENSNLNPKSQALHCVH